MTTIVGATTEGDVQRARRRIGAAAAVLVALLWPVPPHARAATHGLRIETLHVRAPGVSDTPLRVRIAVPSRCRARGARCDTLYVNDGQDAEAVGLFDTVAALEAAGSIRAPLVVAIDAPADRMGAYGFSDRAAGRPVIAPTRYGDVGARAHAYAQWLTGTLVPRVQARHAVRSTAASRAILGWSLGGAQAFDVGWQYPAVIGRVGAFSPSFWLARDQHDAASVQRTRIAQSMLVHGAPAQLRLFLSVGTDEERDDRDGDGVNDARDDVAELVDGSAGQPGLRQLGYRITDAGGSQAGRGDVAVVVLPGGIHRQSSWARMLPAFLHWAYGRDGGTAAAPSRRVLSAGRVRHRP